MKTTIRNAALATTLLLASPALAQSAADTDTPSGTRLDAAWKWLDQAMAPTLTEAQRPKLIWAAYNAAAGAMCNEVTVDEAKLGKELEALLPAADDTKVTDAQRKFLHDTLLLHLGSAMGIFAAENADNLPEFCADAVALRDDPATAGKNLFLSKDDDTAPSNEATPK